MATIQERVIRLQENIRRYAGERPVTLVAVSKYATVGQMQEAYAAGIRHFGENKIQDALAKMEALPSDEWPGLHWHFIGPLQTNKAKKTVGRFDLLHAIGTVHQAEAVDKANRQAGYCQPVLLQVNLSGDASRHGIAPDQLQAVVSSVMGLEGIAMRGLMAMAPAKASIDRDEQELKAVFCRLRDMRDRLEGEFAIRLPDLSMGMTHDYPQALICGATIIRIGNYLFQN